MHTFVQLEVGLRDELLLTYVARKLLSGVDSHHMRIPAGRLRETLAANLARELLARMNTNMVLEMVHLSEPLFANFAFKRTFARV